jgi:hypothetical protein
VLKSKENLTDQQRVRLSDLLKYNLQTVRAYLLKEQFRQFWSYDSPAWAAKFLDQWITLVMRSRIEPMKKVAKTLRNHREPPQLLSGQKAVLQRRCRGSEQQGQSDHEKILRVSDLQNH